MKTLFSSLTILFCLSFVKAQITTELSEVYITDNRISIPISETDRLIQVISKSDIENSPATSIENLLSLVSGIDIRQRGVNGAQADVSIRGSSFEQVLVLINGTRMSDVQTGHHSMDLPVSLHSVERIVIVKGPSARRYGQNAYAGVIDIITKLNTKSSLEVNLSAADFGTFGLDAEFQTGGEEFKQLIQASYNQTDGYRYNTDSKRSNFWYQNELSLGKHKLSFQGGFTEKKFGANGFYATPSATEQYEETQSSLANVKADFDFNQIQLNASVYWRRHQDLYVFVRENPSIYRNMHIGNTVGASSNLMYSSRFGESAFGLEGRKEFLRSNNLGNWQRTSVSLFFEHKFKLLNSKLDVTPGFLVSDFNDFGTFFYPGIDVGYSISNHHRLYANMGKTYRTPTYTDLFYTDSVTEGNPNLKPEEALAYELGYRFQKQNWNFEINGFIRNSKNTIDWVKELEEDKWEGLNIAKVNLLGFESSVSYRFQSTFINSISLNYTYLDKDLNEEDTKYSKYILDHLKHQFIANLNHKIRNGINVEWIYRYNNRLTLDDYHLFDAKMRWENKNFELNIQCNNIFNTAYTETNLIPMPRRWFGGGVKVKI